MIGFGVGFALFVATAWDYALEYQFSPKIRPFLPLIHGLLVGTGILFVVVGVVLLFPRKKGKQGSEVPRYTRRRGLLAAVLAGATLLVGVGIPVALAVVVYRTRILLADELFRIVIVIVGVPLMCVLCGA